MEKQIQLSKQISDWIISHPLFKMRGAVQSIGLHQGNFWRAIRAITPYLKPEVTDKLVPILRDYGFTPLTFPVAEPPAPEKVVKVKPIKYSPAGKAAFNGKKTKESAYTKKRRQLKSSK